jgi:hypothetical protein
MPTDDMLKRELSRGPLKKNGFDERLRRRIEERLDEGPSRRPFRPHRLAGAGMALCAMIFAAVLMVRLHPMQTDEVRQAAESPGPQSAADTAAADDAEVTPRRSVLLLGLRQDGADGEASAYRTLLVSGGPSPSDWTAAEGEGIVMPYRIDFWRLDVREYEGWGSMIRLAGAWNASRGDMLPPSPIPAGMSVGSVEERILFAGNRYIAIARRTGGEWTQRMLEITDLAQPRNLTAILSGTERQVPLEVKADGRIGTAEYEKTGQTGIGEWTFGRKSGLWMAFGRELVAGIPAEFADRRPQGFAFDASLVAHNELALNWKDIREVQPAAVDAVTSPIRNMAAVLTDRKVVFYSMRGGKLDREMFEMELRPGEKVIMAEWATHPEYVGEWMVRVAELFEKSRN